MKVKWEFFFEYEDLEFEKPYSYTVPISSEHAEAFGLPSQEFEAAVTIRAEEKKHGHLRQLGKIHIILPGRGEQTKDLAYSLARSVEQHVTFSQARIKLDGGFISNELLPETDEEEKEVGENRYSMFVQLRQVTDPIRFDSASIQKLTNNPLLRQFNDANNARSPIDRFIGLFKILEDLYGGHPIKPALKSSTDLRQIAFQNLHVEKDGKREQISPIAFEKLIDDLANTRHECAHLRSSTGFGLTYGDSRVESDVEPLLVPLEVLAYQAVRKRIGLI